MTTLLLGFSKELEPYLRGTPCAFGPCVSIAARFATWRNEVKQANPDLLVINVHALLRQHSFAGEYEGVEVLKHLRLTTDLGPVRTCHVVLVSWESPGEIIRRGPGNSIVFSSGVTFLHTTEMIELLADSNRLESLSRSVATLADTDLLAAVRADYKPPDSGHEMSNWWGAWRLIQSVEENPKMPAPVCEKMSRLSTKQALFLDAVTEAEHGFPRPSIARLQSLVRKTAPTICYVDDESDQGWEQAFTALLYGASDSSSFKVINPIVINAIGGKSVRDVSDLANEILGLSPNLLILDLRLGGADDSKKAPKDTGGALLLKEIRKQDRGKGLPILLMTASNKARTLQDVVKLGGDAYWMKEGIGEHAPLYAVEDPAIELIRLLEALLGEDWQFLLRLQAAHEALRVDSEQSRCWWSHQIIWNATDWPSTNPPFLRRVRLQRWLHRTQQTQYRSSVKSPPCIESTSVKICSRITESLDRPKAEIYG